VKPVSSVKVFFSKNGSLFHTYKDINLFNNFIKLLNKSVFLFQVN